MSELHKGLKAELARHTSTAGFLAGVAPAPDRIYPLVIPQKRRDGAAQVPAVVYATQGIERQVTYCGTEGLIKTTLVLDLYALKFDDVKDLANAVRECLQDFRGLLGDIVRVKAANLISEFDLSDIEPGLYRVSQSWSIWHLE